MKSYDFLKELFRGKAIVYVPIISCIDRDTNEYNLAADGNVNRFITTFSLCDTFKSLTIALPKKHIEGSEKLIQEFISDCNDARIVWIEDFGKHAKDQRMNYDIVDSIYQGIKDLDCDLYLFESQLLGLELNRYAGKQLVWWNPVSATDTKTRIFLKGYGTLNEIVMDISDYTIVASPDQLEYYGYSYKYSDKLIYIDKLMDRTLRYFEYELDNDVLKYSSYDKKVFFLPYRLTDEGYQFDKVIEYMSKEKDWIALYTDPNESHAIDYLDESIRDKFVKVSSKRNTYYTILDYVDAVIPYFEDLEFINHAAIHEFKHTKCKVVLWKQHKNPYDIDNCSNIEVIDKI